MAIRPTKLTRGFGNGTYSGRIAARVTQGFYVGNDPAILEIIQFSAPGTALLQLSAPGVTLLQIKSSYN